MKRGILDIICEETGATRLHTGSRVLETPAQAKYNDARKAETGYVQGVYNANEETKTQRAIKLFIYGDRVGAVKIFSSFKVGFTKEEKRTLEIAYECQTGHDNFYQKLGIDTDAIWTKAKEIIKNKYGI